MKPWNSKVSFVLQLASEEFCGGFLQWATTLVLNCIFTPKLMPFGSNFRQPILLLCFFFFYFIISLWNLFLNHNLHYLWCFYSISNCLFIGSFKSNFLQRGLKQGFFGHPCLLNIEQLYGSSAIISSIWNSILECKLNFPLLSSSSQYII